MADDRRANKTLKLTETGELFGDLFTRSDWSCEEQPECLRDLIYFIDHYATKVVGVRGMARFHKDHPDKTVLDKLTMSDIAYAILIYENTVDVWDEITYNKEKSAHDEERTGATQKYHIDKGSRLPTFSSGWTDDGVQYMKDLEDNLKGLRENDDFWNRLVEDWRSYAKENARYLFEKKNLDGQEGWDEDDADGAPIYDLPDDDADMGVGNLGEVGERVNVELDRF